MDNSHDSNEPVAWNVINPAGEVVATETNAVRGWARIAGYKPTVEGLLGFHEQGWRVVPTSAQPAQELVAYSYTSRITGAQGFSHHPMPRFIDSESWDIKPLYTSPPASKPWVGLTDEEREHIWNTVGNSDAHGDVDGWSGRYVMATIEAKLRERNT